MRANSVANKILKSIRGKGRGSVHTAKDFLDIDMSRTAVDQTLSRLAKKGILSRVAWGIYLYPKTSKRLGVLSPSLDSVARAAVGKDGVLQVTKARAANSLGLSTQVPARTVYLTDSATRRVIKLGGQSITLRPAGSKTLAGAGKMSGYALQALRYLGPDGVDDATIDILRSHLSPTDKLDLRRVAHKAPDWMLPFVAQVTQGYA